MLSPAKWYLRVPKEPVRNLKFRRFLLLESMGNPDLQAGLRLACAQDILFFINAWVWQFNPRKPGNEVEPFITWEFQDEALRAVLDCIECRCHEEEGVHQHDMLWEKSREMGATWLFLIVALWLCLFHNSKQILMISKSESAVEDESPDSLYWKLDYMLEHLPDWMKGKIVRRKRYLGFDSGSSITGEASTGRAGVGGRATVMFIDEFSQIKEDFEVLHRTSDTTGCRIFNGTHRGTGTAFHQLTLRPDLRKVMMHWTSHPFKRRGLYRFDAELQRIVVEDKTFHFPTDFEFVLTSAPAGGPCPGLRSPWYDRQCLRKGSPRAVAMDLDIDVQGSSTQFFDPLTLGTLIRTYCQAPWWEGDIHYETDTGRPLSLVKREGGPLRLWCHLNLQPDGQYRPPPMRCGAGADVSAGTGATPSCLSLANGRTGEKVLEYSNRHIAPETFALVCVAICQMFPDENGQGTLFAWEMAGPGLQMGNEVVRLGYRRIYYRSNEFDLNRTISDRPGWYPTRTSVRLMLENYRAALYNRHFMNPSVEALRECAGYSYGADETVTYGRGKKDKDDPSGTGINHGDLVVADGLCYMMVRDMTTKKREAEDEKAPYNSMAWRRQYARKRRSQQESWA